MLFIALLIALSFADLGVIDMSYCEDKTVNVDFNVTTVSYEKPAEREITHYIINFDIYQLHEDVILTWRVEYYWGTLFVASYKYDDQLICETIEGGCKTTGPKHFKADGKVSESVTLPGWYLLVLEMTDHKLFHNCFHGWVYLY
ncbi:hypothetical protein EIN_467240 [Entamoeba invadens IP1]|uniref:MD-2-related lipid-recognition domain-containing protein n=1 Tax=Entamoeba invadens IP1 TaxID=370355 RepID=A0A0A1TUG1_ENTIV|nr:hypothetical protein EIN_467240 [Entamoeba invadens IP1]ELP83660.1 hypothetical protein EIN_467240 [Entamoeba invadens IP1]|eukprot:XP_004183006.1 hypothetical protein EIN_467240 [Entamoeba invadens IP1]